MSKKDIFNGDGGWAEIKVEPRELIVPRSHVDLDDDIPTLPDLDELQDALEQESETVSSPEVPDKWKHPNSSTFDDLETEEAHLGDVNLTALLSNIRAVAGAATLEADTVWTVASLLDDLSSKAQGK